jgi:hypothetical protein
MNTGVESQAGKPVIARLVSCQGSGRTCMKYKIICDKHEFEFENKINLLLEQDRKLYSEIVVSLINTDKDLLCWYTQSMVKDD